jgi:O-methyltransferase
LALGRALRKVARPLMHKMATRLTGFPEWVPGPLTYNQDGLATVHNCDFLHDPHFLEAYRILEEARSSAVPPIQWRAFVVCWAADRASRLEGDFVECGVNTGGLSRMVMQYVGFPRLDKTFYLLDTFRGLEDKYLSDAERKRGIKYEDCYEAACRTFEGFRAVIVRGAVPESLPQVKATKVCYLSIDMNCAAPEVAAAEYFWDKLVPGAVIVLDDYGWKLCYEQKVAFDRFAREKGVMVLGLPTGQGLIFKP